MKDNTYEKYRNVLTLEQFFLDWDPTTMESLTDALKKRIYERYIIKCFVFQRDQFKCLNKDCKTPNSPLTLHHIRFQKNGGKDSVRNCATICRSCHQGFHKAKHTLTFWGMTYKIHIDDSIDWKKVKAKNRKMRKELKDQFGIQISTELFIQLFRFLSYAFEEDLEDSYED